MRSQSESGCRRTAQAGLRRWMAWLWGTGASQLVEFAFVFPLLLVLVVGIADFGRAYNLKQKLNNAAREGARIAIGQTQIDLSQTNPLTIQAIAEAVVNYLNGENVDTSLIDSSQPCAADTAIRTWAYCQSGTSDQALVIERNFIVTGASGIIVSTRVTLNYPFSWSFSQIIRLLVPSASYSDSFTISSDAVMKNLT